MTVPPSCSSSSTAARDTERYTSDWFRSFLAYDPAESTGLTITVPGVERSSRGKDVQVHRPSRGRTHLRAALEALAGNRGSVTDRHASEDANHLFQEAETGAFWRSTARLEPEFIDGFLDTVVDWFGRPRTGVARVGMAGSDDPLDRPTTARAWHPEPELLDVRDEATSRPALEKLGEEAWSAALDYVYEHGHGAGYRRTRPTTRSCGKVFFGPSGRPGAGADSSPTTSQALIEEFRTPPRTASG